MPAGAAVYFGVANENGAIWFFKNARFARFLRCNVTCRGPPAGHWPENVGIPAISEPRSSLGPWGWSFILRSWGCDVHPGVLWVGRSSGGPWATSWILGGALGVGRADDKSNRFVAVGHQSGDLTGTNDHRETHTQSGGGATAAPQNTKMSQMPKKAKKKSHW